MMYGSYLLTAAADSAELGTGGSIGVLIANALPLIFIFVIFYFMLIRPQRKRDKQVQKMRSNLEVGDEIITIGGIIGRVVSLREDTIVIETGSDRSKIRIQRAAVQTNNTVHDDTSAQ